MGIPIDLGPVLPARVAIGTVRATAHNLWELAARGPVTSPAGGTGGRVGPG